MPKTMLEAQVSPSTTVQLLPVPVPLLLQPNDIIIRVVCVSCNPKDWKLPAGLLKTIANCPNSGDDMAGFVHQVGSAVTTCKPGDRVAALHQLGAPHGAFAEYALVKDFACFKLPDAMGWEASATLPMGVYMACIALFGSLGVAAGPWERAREGVPLLVYGATTGVGSMAVKLAQVIGAHPVICVAGSGCEFAASLIDKSKGDVVIDYRKGDETVIKGIRSVLAGRDLEYAFDAVSEPASLAVVAQVLKSDGRLALTLPGRAHTLPQTLRISHVMAGSLWTQLSGLNESERLGNLGLEAGGPDFAREMTASIEQLLAEAKLKPHPHTVYEHGLAGLQQALQDLRNGKVSSSRCVVRLAETPGVQAGHE